MRRPGTEERPSGGSGAEGITFVPDRYLEADGFVDRHGAPYVSTGGMNGLIFVGHQNGGRIYVFDLDRPVDVVWGELANIVVGPDDISLGRVGQIGCNSTAAGYRYHSRDPIPGEGLLYLAREVGEPSYGDGFDFRPRIATDGDCP